jgi:hypothetical protein
MNPGCIMTTRKVERRTQRISRGFTIGLSSLASEVQEVFVKIKIRKFV